MNLKEIEKNIGEILVKINVYKNPTDTLFIRGEMSNYILEEDFQNVLESFHNGVIKTIPKVGHWLHAENPIEFYKIVNKFKANKKKVIYCLLSCISISISEFIVKPIVSITNGIIPLRKQMSC